MTLLEFIKSPNVSPAQLAAKVNIAPAYLYQISHGKRSASAALSRAIEDATGGAVMRWDLRQDDWHLIWPELRSHPNAPAVHEVAA